jgi:hypothetical protein
MVALFSTHQSEICCAVVMAGDDVTDYAALKVYLCCRQTSFLTIVAAFRAINRNQIGSGRVSINPP